MTCTCMLCGHDWAADALGDCPDCGGTSALTGAGRRMKRARAKRLADGRVLVSMGGPSEAWHVLLDAGEWAALVASVAP